MALSQFTSIKEHLEGKSPSYVFGFVTEAMLLGLRERWGFNPEEAEDFIKILYDKFGVLKADDLYHIKKGLYQ